MSRIFHVISATHPGGSEIIATELVCRARASFSSLYIVPVRSPRADVPSHFSERFVGRLAAAGVSLLPAQTQRFPLGVPWAAYRFCRAMKLSADDVVHVHSDIPEFFGMFVRWFSSATLVRTIHNVVFWPGRRWMGRTIERALAGAHRVACSEQAREASEAHRRQSGVHGGPPCEVVYNGIEPATAPAPSATLLARRPGRMNVLFIGRLELQKGFDVLLDALQQMAPAARDRLWLHVVGDGLLREAGEAQVRRHDLPVSFYGSVFNARAVVPESDLLVMPSRFEGLGLVAVEALLADRDVLATDAPGLQEVFAMDRSRLVPVEDAPALSRRLAALAEGWRGRPYTAPAALRASVEERFGLARMVREYDAVYARILASR